MKNKKQKGFTLIELLVVIAIIGILAAIGLSALTSARKKARDSRRKSDLREVANALELFYADNGQYPVASGFTDLISKLSIYMDREIKDPLNNGNYKYCYGVSNDSLYYRMGAALEVASDSSMWQDGHPRVAPTTPPTTPDQSGGGSGTGLYELGNALGNNEGQVTNCKQ